MAYNKKLADRIREVVRQRWRNDMSLHPEEKKHMTKQTGYCPVHNGELYYEVEGADSSNAIVFIHACICDHNMWDVQVSAFMAHYRVLRYDQRGHGASRTQDTDYSGT